MTDGENRYALYDDLLSPVAVLEGGVFAYFNQAFAQFLQLPPRKIRGKSLADVLANPALESYLQGGVTPEVVVGTGEHRKEVVLKFFRAEPAAVVMTIQDFSLERILHAKHRIQLDEIKKYSEGLEVLVEQRTTELRSEKEQTEGILRSIREGLFVVEKNLKIGAQCSAATYSMLGHPTLTGLDATQVLFPSALTRTASEEQKKLRDFLASAFSLFIPEQFEDLVPFAPKMLRFTRVETRPRLFSLSYSAVVDNGDIVRIIVALRDDTELEELRSHAVLVHRRVVETLARLKEARLAVGGAELCRFVEEADGLLSQVLPALKTFSHADVAMLFRLLHTVKGGARQHKLAFLEHFAHEAEDVLDLYRSGKEVDGERHAKLLTDVEALALGVSAMAGLGQEAAKVPDPAAAFRSYLTALEASTVALARDLGKAVRLESKVSACPEGSDLSLLTRILGHLVRNALDHGIEDQASRLLKGKTAGGSLRLTLDFAAGAYNGRLEDDGAGIDLTMLARKAKLPRVDLQQALRMLAAPGFTTKTTVSEVSGRGVGLDAVMSELEAVGGRLAIESSDSSGTVFTFSFYAKASAVVRAS